MNKMLQTHEFYDIQLNNYVGWDRTSNRNVYFVMAEFVYDDTGSAEISAEIESDLKNIFYYRDWTKDGIPFINKGETYWSGFWFKCKEDAELFAERYSKYCMGNWMEGYDAFLKNCNDKRNCKN